MSITGAGSGTPLTASTYGTPLSSAAVTTTPAPFTTDSTYSGLSAATTPTLGPPYSSALANANVSENGWTNSTSPVNVVSWLGHVNHFTVMLSNSLSGTTVPTTVTMNINPDDFVLDTPYRVNATQTMSGAFVDVWGKTIVRLTLRGNTGWRTHNFSGSTSQAQDGYANVMALKNLFDNYFLLRDTNSANFPQSQLEQKLTVHIIDKLHRMVHYVVPEQFKLLRNKSNPLLHMYEASFIVTQENTDFQVVNSNNSRPPVTIKKNNSSSPSGFWSKLGSTLSTIAAVASDVMVAMEVLNQVAYAGGGIGGLLSVVNPSSTPGLTMMAQETFNSIGGAMMIAQNGTSFNTMSVTAQLAWKDTTQFMKDASTLATQVTPMGITVPTNLVSSGPVPPYVGAIYSIAEDTPNTFIAVTAAANTSGIQTAVNQISVANTTAAKDMNSVDMILKLIGR